MHTTNQQYDDSWWETVPAVGGGNSRVTDRSWGDWQRACAN